MITNCIYYGAEKCLEHVLFGSSIFDSIPNHLLVFKCTNIQYINVSLIDSIITFDDEIGLLKSTIVFAEHQTENKYLKQHK